MAKYSYELKKQVVMSYLSGQGGYQYLSKKYSISSDSNVKAWVDNYREFGDEGLMRSRKQKKYSLEKKLSIIN